MNKEQKALVFMLGLAVLMVVLNTMMRFKVYQSEVKYYGTLSNYYSKKAEIIKAFRN